MKDLPQDNQAQVAYIAYIVSDIKTQGPYSLKEIPYMVTFKFMEKSSATCNEIKYWSYAAKYNLARYLLDRKGVKYG